MIPIHKYIGLELFKLKGDFVTPGNEYKLAAYTQATNLKVPRCHETEALEDCTSKSNIF